MANNTKNVQVQSEILTLVEGVAIQSEGWYDYDSPLTDKEIDNIKDPEGATDRKEITSIPSPFARMHLAESAFKIVSSKSENDPGYLDKSTVYHKLVSDCLDLGEIFFKYDNFSKKHDIRIVKWNRKEHIAELKGGSQRHRLLGETLELFWNEQKDDSNFIKTENLHFLYYQDRIVGGTSPTSLFFTCANDLSHVALTQGNDTFFDDDYYPLYKRGKSYQRYLYGLFKVYQLSEAFPSFWKYLLVNMERLREVSPDDYHDLAKITEGTYNKEDFFKEFERWKGSEIIEIFPGYEHLKSKGGGKQQSDFFIDSAKYTRQDKLPLVLENGLQRKLRYWGGLWDASTRVPYRDDAKLDERFLPGQDAQYPYLTISDFLEPYLIEVPYHINDKNFWTGTMDGFFSGDKVTKDPPDNSYLLPIKSLYFSFFDLNDLKKSLGNKPVFRMVKVGMDGVRVELRIPIKSSDDQKFVLFERLYKTGENPDESQNVGSIRKCKFNLGFLPFQSDNTKTAQRVGFVDADVMQGNRNSLYSINFHKITETGSFNTSCKYETTRSDEARGHNHNATTKYYILEENYDFIEINKEDQAKGIIVPTFPPTVDGSKNFTFAIDFGTTNSHIEYAVGDGDPTAFNISQEDKQLITLTDDFGSISFPVLETLLNRELIPDTIGSKEKYRFPMRTVVSEIDNLNHHKATYAMADINIPFHYEKESILKSEVISTNLKWMPLKSKNKENINRVESFIESILIMIQNKVTLNNGNLEKTTIIWFYPSSMSTNQIGQYRNIWDRLFRKYILSNIQDEREKDQIVKNRLLDFSESEVPFYNHDEVISYEHPVINIDIGGGTTDIVVFKEDAPVLLTSVKFAGNTVFGDGYTKSKAANNGFVKVFKPVVETFLNNNRTDLNELYNVFNQLAQTNQVGSADLMAFFFSLEKNNEIAEKNLELRLSEEIGNHHEFNIVFILFYGAIIYHIAKIMKHLNLSMPRNISFSGNGSKIIRLLDPTSDLEGVKELSKIIFVNVYNAVNQEAKQTTEPEIETANEPAKRIHYHEDGLDLVQGKEPKEATCKGGIMKLKSKKDKRKFDKVVLMGDREDTLINVKPVNFSQKTFTYEELTNEHKDSIIEEIKSFIDMLFDIHKQIDFEDSFGIDPSKLPQYKTVLLRDLKANLSLGLDERLKLSDKSKNLEETLFFYPLVASIYRLTQEIANG